MILIVHNYAQGLRRLRPRGHCLLLLGGCGGGESGGSGTLNALFMKQAAYSETDVKSMTEQFQKQNPGIKVNLTFVAYEALHDKIVAAAPPGRTTPCWWTSSGRPSSPARR